MSADVAVYSHPQDMKSTLFGTSGQECADKELWADLLLKPVVLRSDGTSR